MKYRLLILPVFLLILLVSHSCRQAKPPAADDTDSIDPRLTELTKQIEKSPEDHILFYKRTLVYLELKMPYEALNDINKALQIDPQNTKYTITLGDIYFSMGHIENSRKALITAQDNDPTNVEPILKLAELDLILKDYEKMNMYLNKVLELDKTNSQAFFMRGVALKEQGDSAGALKLLHQATMNDPENYKAFVEAGILASEMKKPIAEEYLNTALNLKPSSIEARYALAMYYQDLGKLNEAMAEYYNILNIDKKHAYAHFNLGYIHLVDLQLYNQAVVHFSDAVQSNPRYAEAYYNRGYCYELLGNVEAARRDYQEALSIKTNYQKAIDGLNRLDRPSAFQN
jgi:tetratricopeptide (TPR) repeat protein